MVWWNWKNKSTLGKMGWWSDGAPMVWWSIEIELKWYKSVFSGLNWRKNPSTVGQNDQKSKLKYWATRLSIRSFVCTARCSLVCMLHTTHFACLPRCAHSLARLLACSLTHFAHFQARREVIYWMAIYSVFFFDLAHSAIRPWSDGTEKTIWLLVKCVNGLMGLPWSDEA